jgi:hypothetical protein
MFQAPHTSVQHADRMLMSVKHTTSKSSAARRASKPDPIIGLLGELETARRRYVAARKALSRIEKENDKTLWQDAGVGPNGNDLMLLGNFQDCWFTSVHSINRWARGRIAEAEADRKISHRGGPKHAARRIARVRKLRPLLKKELAKRQAEVAKSRKAIGWDVAKAELIASERQFWKQRYRVSGRRPSSTKGVHAVLTFIQNGVWAARHKEETKAVPPWMVEEMVEKVQLALHRLAPGR